MDLEYLPCFGVFMGYIPDVTDGVYTYRWDDKQKKYVRVEKDNI